MKLDKMAQVLSGIVLVLIGVSCCMGVSFLTLQPQGSFTLFGITRYHTGEPIDSPLPWLMIVLVPILFVEGGIWRMKRSWAMGDTRGTYPLSNVWSMFGRFSMYIGLASSAMAAVALLVLLAAGLIMLASVLLANPISLFLRPLFVVAAGSTLYILLRIPVSIVWRSMGGRATRLARQGMAKYRLLNGGVEIDLASVTIDLKTLSVSNRLKPPKVRISFDELDEVRSLSPMEAETFLDYTVGPNVELFARQTRDVYQYYKGEIPRPTVYFLTGGNGAGGNLLLRGPELFYFLSFEADNLHELVDAFQRYKSARRATVNEP